MLLTLPQLMSFATASVMVILSPGPDNLGTLGIGLSRGKREAVAFAIGCALGCLTHTVWVAIGVAKLLKASPTAFLILKILGAAYLIYLGVRSLRSSGSKFSPDKAEPISIHRYLLRGFIANAINPKVALFFFAFLPLFVREDRSVTGQIVALGGLFVVMTMLIFSMIGLFAGQIGIWLQRRAGATRLLDRATGILFIVLGIMVLLQSQ